MAYTSALGWLKEEVLQHVQSAIGSDGPDNVIQLSPGGLPLVLSGRISRSSEV